MDLAFGMDLITKILGGLVGLSAIAYIIYAAAQSVADLVFGKKE